MERTKEMNEFLNWSNMFAFLVEVPLEGLPKHWPCPFYAVCFRHASCASSICLCLVNGYFSIDPRYAISSIPSLLEVVIHW